MAIKKNELVFTYLHGDSATSLEALHILAPENSGPTSPELLVY